jgi:hypothetical protein
VSIRNFLNRFPLLRTFPRGGDRVIVHFFGGCMDTVQRSCTASVIFRRDGIYTIKLDTGEIIRTHDGWLHYDPSLNVWIVRE